MGTVALDSRGIASMRFGEMEMDCRVMTKIETGGFSHESENDLSFMVRDFLETGSDGSGGLSCCSSDSDGGCSDLFLLADKVQFLKYSMAQHEANLLSVIRSLVLSIQEKDLHSVKPGPCNASCIRFYLAKLLRLSGYNSAVCSARWQGTGKVPGGDHEYIDVINCSDDGNDEDEDQRLIVDIDFRSHFEIARAVDSYHHILNALPAVFVGSPSQLNEFLRLMVDATRFSLKQNSMPVPPWRSLPYLQSKWNSSYQRHVVPFEQIGSEIFSGSHRQCFGHLRTLQTGIQSELDSERLLNPMKKTGKDNGSNRRVGLGRTKHLPSRPF